MCALLYLKGLDSRKWGQNRPNYNQNLIIWDKNHGGMKAFKTKFDLRITVSVIRVILSSHVLINKLIIWMKFSFSFPPLIPPVFGTDVIIKPPPKKSPEECWNCKWNGQKLRKEKKKKESVMLMKCRVHHLKNRNGRTCRHLVLHEWCVASAVSAPLHLSPVLLFYYKQSCLNSNLIRPHAYIKYSHAFAL